MDFEEQLALLRSHVKHDGAIVELQPLGSGARVVQIKNYKLPGGWDQQVVNVEVYVPPGYPSANLDCFWVEPQLRLANGNPPQSSNTTNPMPEVGLRGTWFSWHIPTWRPNHDTLVTFFNSIRSRLDTAQ